MSELFAKIFLSEEYGQILIYKGTNDAGNPSLRVSCAIPDAGICELSPSWDDTDAGWNSLDKAFNDAEMVMAETFAKAIVDQCSQFTTKPIGG